MRLNFHKNLHRFFSNRRNCNAKGRRVFHTEIENSQTFVAQTSSKPHGPTAVISYQRVHDSYDDIGRVVTQKPASNSCQQVVFCKKSGSMR